MAKMPTTVKSKENVMIFDYSQNNINIIFELDETQRVLLKEFSVSGHSCLPKENLKWSSIIELHITGENPNDHHGGKHTGTSESVCLKYVSHNYYQNQLGNKLEFVLENKKVRAVVHYQFFENTSVVRVWNQITNISNENIGLEYVSSFTYTGLDDSPFVYIPHNSWCCELGWKKYTLNELGFDRVNKFTLKKVGAYNTGSWSTKEFLPMGAVSQNDNTILWQIENNGSWCWEISDIADMLYLKLSGPCEQENAWYKELKPNQSFESVKCCIAVADNFDNALAQMTKYRRIIFKNNVPNSKLPVIFNDYMNCLKGDPTTEKLLPIIDKAAQAGAEYFCIDCGWYANGSWWDTVGEWQPCEWRFPNGIKEVFDYIKSKNMVPGIWLEIEVMGICCPLLDDFEDECFFMRHGKKIIDHSRYQLDFRNEKVRRFAHSVIDRVVAEYGVGYIKFDYNIEPGIGTEVNSDSFGDGLLQHNRAYVSWIKEIKEKYPDLIIENCASGGMRMDYAMLEETHLQSVSDQTNYRHTAVISANCATAVLPEQAAIWSYPLANGNPDEAEFNMVNSMLSRIHLSGDIANLSDIEFANVKKGIACYKNLREHIPQSLPFYPLGLNGYEKGWACVGYQTDSKKYIAVWRLNANESSIFIPLNDVTAANIVYPANQNTSISMDNNGVNVNLKNNYSAVIFEAIN